MHTWLGTGRRIPPTEVTSEKRKRPTTPSDQPFDEIRRTRAYWYVRTTFGLEMLMPLIVS